MRLPAPNLESLVQYDVGAEREDPELAALVVREEWHSDRGLCRPKTW